MKRIIFYFEYRRGGKHIIHLRDDRLSVFFFFSTFSSSFLEMDARHSAASDAILHEILDRLEGSLIIFPRGLPAAPSEPMGQAILSGRSQLARNGHVRRRNHLGYSIFFSISFPFSFFPSSSSFFPACPEEPTINYISKHFSDPPSPSPELMDFTGRKRNETVLRITFPSFFLSYH